MRDLDGTVVFTLADEPRGGSLKTIGFALKQGKPCINISRVRAGYSNPAFELQEFGIKNLNVAGSSETNEPGTYQWVMEVLEDAFFWSENNSSMLGGSR